MIQGWGKCLKGISVLFVLGLPFAQASQDYAPEDWARQPVKRRSIQKALSAVPYGASQAPAPAECEPEYLRELLKSTPEMSWSLRGNQIRNYILSCKKTFQPQDLGPIGVIIGDALAEYEFTSHPDLKPTELKLRGFKRKFFVGLQATDEKRPIILIQCGLGCNPNSQSVAAFLMMLFDEGPFHVVLVPSISGTLFQKDNHVALFGGAAEGLLLTDIAKWIRSDACPWKNQVSSIHIMGFSLGGQAALFASAYETSARARGAAPLVESVISGCPVVSLKDSVQSLFEGSLLAQLFSSGLKNNLEDVRSYVPVFDQVLGKKGKLKDSDYFPLIGQAGLIEHQRSGLDRVIDDLLGTVPVSHLEDFWALNDFTQHVGKVNVPTLVLAAEDDPVVLTAKNFDRLAAGFAEMNSDSVALVKLPSGGHCSFHRGNGWRSVGAVYREFFQATSSAPVLRSRTLRPLKGFKGVEWANVVEPNYRLNGIHFTLKAGEKTVRLLGEYLLADPKNHRGGRLASKDRYFGRVPLASLNPVGVRIPRNDVEAQALSRRLNTLVRLKFSDDFGDFRRPVSIEVETFGAQKF